MASTHSWIAPESQFGEATNVRFTSYTIPLSSAAVATTEPPKWLQTLHEKAATVYGTTPQVFEHPRLDSDTKPLSFGLQYDYGVSAQREQPRYCRKCGAIMRSSTRVVEYDSQTCDPKYEQKVSCPYYNIWHALLGQITHDRAEKDSTGYWVRK